jgi:hypothetical protein
MSTSRIGGFVLCVVVVVAAVHGCGGKANPGGAVCETVAACAKEDGEEFSLSECEQELLFSFEESDSVGCGEEWKALYDCASRLSCSALKKLSDLEDECESAAEALEKCTERARDAVTGGADGGTPVSGDY